MKAKRNASVELLRLFGILMILGYHNMQTDLKLYSTYSFVTDFWTCFYCDCVPMFFMIMGFYLFNEKNTYEKVLKKMFFNIMIPVALLFIAYFYLYDWIINGETLIESIKHPLSEYVAYFASLAKFESPHDYTNHTWYLFLYIMVTLTFPVMKAFADYLDKDAKREKIFMAGTLGLFLVNDLFSNGLMEFSYHTLGGVIPAFIMILWGHIIYRHRDVFTGKKIYALYGELALIGCNLVRTGIVRLLSDPTTLAMTNTHVKNWYGALGLINPVLMIIVAFNIIDGAADTKTNRVILALASINLQMYLLHQICIDWITAIGLRKLTTAFVRGYFPGKFGDFVLTFINTFITFILTYILVFIVLGVKKLIIKCWSSRKKSA